MALTDHPDDEQFQRLLAGEDEVDLPELLLEFARDADPQLAIAACRQELARLGEEAKRLVAGLGAQRADIGLAFGAVARYLWEVGFRGAEEEYYDPRNSLLHEVLSRRTGLPIMLSLVLVAVARSARLPAYGVGTPGHFIAGCDSQENAYYVDLFSSPEVLTRRECRRRLLARTGLRQIPTKAFAPASHREIAVRVLRNLKNAYARRDDWTGALAAQRRLARLLPGDLDECRDLGLLLLRNAQPFAALDCFDQYLEARPDDAEQLQPFVRTARRLGAELN